MPFRTPFGTSRLPVPASQVPRSALPRPSHAGVGGDPAGGWVVVGGERHTRTPPRRAFPTRLP